ncbi:uncharacterized protein LOC127755509 isoform X1 [Oryza glaberrima]|uniref:Uncharacterized protein n=1 Tax=Oryza glaberrima TaxID=4538 RepID=I1QXH8_ORYGL|nr:uncharacterized protein LOC127755509 isoform X1 [Oryza glaberrima]
MSLRRLAASALRRGGANDGGVLAAVRAEIAHELSSSPSSSPPSLQSQDIPDFSTVSDAPRGQEVLLRRRDASEEVLVSAVLAPLRFEGEEPLPRDALMKVFVSKPDVKPVMRFDCRAFAAEGDGGSADYDVTAVCYHPFAGECDAGEDKYEGPEFRGEARRPILLSQSLRACWAKIIPLGSSSRPRLPVSRSVPPALSSLQLLGKQPSLPQATPRRHFFQKRHVFRQHQSHLHLARCAPQAPTPLRFSQPPDSPPIGPLPRRVLQPPSPMSDWCHPVPATQAIW